MRILGARIHGALDLAIVVIFVFAPLLVGLGGIVATAAYALAAIHLFLTLITNFPYGIVKAIPFFVHGLVELGVGVFLLVLPTVLGAAPGSPARRFYTVAGALVLVIWILTDYRGSAAAAD